jgi:hypothetical protein
MCGTDHANRWAIETNRTIDSGNFLANVRVEGKKSPLARLKLDVGLAGKMAADRRL